MAYSQQQIDLDRCYAEQLRCADYLLNVRGDDCRGALQGLGDWVAEEVMIRIEEEKEGNEQRPASGSSMREAAAWCLQLGPV
jgi:hypothetical protein